MVSDIFLNVNYAGQDPYQTSYYDTMVSYAEEKGKQTAQEMVKQIYNYIKTPLATQENVDSLNLEAW